MPKSVSERRAVAQTSSPAQSGRRKPSTVGRGILAVVFAIAVIATVLALVAPIAESASATAGSIPRASRTSGVGIGAPARRAAQRPLTCEPLWDYRVDPSVILAGESRVTGTLHVRATCLGGRFPLHVVILLTGHSDLSPVDALSLRVLLEDIVHKVLGIRGGDGVEQIALIVTEGGRAQTVLPSTANEDRIIRAIGRWHGRGFGAVEIGLLEAHKELRRVARPLGPDDPEPSQIVLHVGDLGGVPRCSSAEREAERLKRDGIGIFTACAGRRCVKQCLIDLASSARYAFDEGDWDRLVNLFGQLYVDRWTSAKWTDIQTQISPEFEYVTYSASPEPYVVDDEMLGWATNFVPRSGVTFTFGLRAPSDRSGELDIATSTTITMRSNHWNPVYATVTRSVPSPRLLILDPRHFPDSIHTLVPPKGHHLAWPDTFSDHPPPQTLSPP